MIACVQTAIEKIELWDVGIREMRYGQVRVKMKMAGICGAQLQECRGEKGSEHIPHLMGHEGVGTVVQVGEGVKLKEGQRVCLHWRKGEGCDVDGGQYFRLTTSGQECAGGPIHTWCQCPVVSANRCTPIPDDIPDELAVLLGCPLSTALGVCENEAKLRMGESVLVVGCGGVGLCCIAAARAMGCAVWAHDKNQTALAIAESMGAKTDTILTDSVDHSIDTTGNQNCINFAALAARGRCVLVGQPAPQETVRLEYARHLFAGEGKRIIASNGGQFCPQKDIPRYIAAWRSGNLKIDGIATHKFPLAQVNEAIEMLKSGKAGRVVLTML